MNKIIKTALPGIIFGLILITIWLGFSINSQKKCVTEVIDGDTVELKSGETVRIEDIDTPEMYYHSKKEPEEGAIKAREEAERVLEGHCFAYTQGKSVVTHETKDQYGRLIGDFILPGGEEFSEYMLKYNFTEPF